MNTTRKLLFAVATVASLSAPLAQANPNWSIGINIGPPPVRYEPVPVPRVGYLWVPGCWEWQGNRHVWIGGHYIREKHHHHYQPSYWNERGGRWYYTPGRWNRHDADRDGVPDRYDRRPNDPRYR